VGGEWVLCVVSVGTTAPSCAETIDRSVRDRSGQLSDERLSIPPSEERLMTTTPPSEVPPRTAPARRGLAAPRSARARRGRDLPVLVFRAVAALVAAVVLGGPGGLADLLAALPGSAAVGDLHRWHHLDLAAYLSLLTLGTLVVAAWSPRRMVVAAQTVLVGLAGFALLALTMPRPDEVLVPVATIALLVVASHPRRRALLQRPPRQLRGGLALAAAALPTPFLVLNAWGNLDRQLTGTDPHALLGHWAGAAALAVALLVTVWVAAMSVPEARWLAVVVAVTLLYLGVAALMLGRHDGAWPMWGAVSAIASAVLFLASLRQAPLRTRRSDTPVGGPAPAIR
jgi:hypothetical protein